uniref:CCHC-type domain-containing protein n=1 Tax=Haemonchus placei TaxID=6290 RepID=A0A0N4W9H4_HAEPC
MTPGNYKIAMDILATHYDEMDILATHYDDKVTVKHILYTKLAQLPHCDLEGRNLQTIYNQMFTLVKIGGEDDCKETGLGAILLNKPPARLLSQIYDRTGNSHNLTPTPTELLNLLTDIVRKDATLFEMEYHARPSNHLQSYSFHASSRSSPDRTLPYKHKKMRPCPFCQSNDHIPNACVAFPTPQGRSRLVKQLRLCYNCLSNQHSSKECTSNNIRRRNVHRSSLVNRALNATTHPYVLYTEACQIKKGVHKVSPHPHLIILQFNPTNNSLLLLRMRLTLIAVRKKTT